mgnify:FL=1
MERNEAAASIQPQQSHFYEAGIFRFSASSEAGLRLRPNFMVGPETPWVGPSSGQVWSAWTQY